MSDMSPLGSGAYLNDEFLRPILPMLDDFDLFSFDIFDTLLLRCCERPADVFTRVGERLRREGLLEYAPATYKALRTEAERMARQTRRARDGGPEAIFEEIFDQFPFDLGLRETMMAYELEAEADVLYLNPNILSLIRHCRSLSKHVVLVSNMYLSEKRIASLLQGAGFDVSLIDACLVSCEQGCDKNGGLFEIMLSRFPDVAPERAIHIGDQPHADVAGARAAGMCAALYSLVSRSFADPFEVEAKKYGSNLGTIFSLRKLAGATHTQTIGDEVFFHKLGAEIFGPVYSFFAEWIVDNAVRLGARVILPFMREGELIARLVRSVLDSRNIQLKCIPWSISRRPAFAAALYEDNVSQKVCELAYKSNCTLNELMRQLGLTAEATPFAALSHYTITQLREQGNFEAVISYFKGDARDAILSFASSQRECLLALLDSLTGGQKALTVDLGTKASTAAYLDAILAREGRAPLSHALLLGADAKNVDNILNGMDVNAFLGLAGENSAKITRLLYPLTVLEALLNATCGTVQYYKKSIHGVESVLEDKDIYSIHEKSLLKALWEGVIAFQRAWLSLDARKKVKDSLIVSPEHFLNILVRFIDMPTPEEALYAGNMRYYDALADEAPMPLRGAPPDGSLPDEKLDELLASCAWDDSIWPQASIALDRPTYFINRYIRETSGDPFVRLCYGILTNARAKGHERIAVYALTENARTFARIADAAGFPIYCFVDGNPHLNGTWAEGKPVVSLRALEGDVDTFVVASVYCADEIRSSILAHYASREKQPAIYDFTGKE